MVLLLLEDRQDVALRGGWQWADNRTRSGEQLKRGLTNQSGQKERREKSVQSRCCSGWCRCAKALREGLGVSGTRTKGKEVDSVEEQIDGSVHDSPYI